MENDFIQLKQELADLTTKFNHLNDLYFRQHFVDKEVFQNTVYCNNGIKGGALGLKIGDSTGKISVYGVTPVVQAGAIASPSGGATVDSQARTAIDLIRTAIKNFGITA